MSDSSLVHIPAFIDDRKVTAYQIGIVALCASLMMLDGYDMQVISYVAPHLLKDWGLTPTVLGTVFSASLAGLMAGTLILAPLSDRIGHKKLLLVTTPLFAVFTFVTMYATSAEQLIALRFLTGFSLSAVLPSGVALTSEISPKRFRASFILAIYCGFSLGFVFAGAAAAVLIPRYGWHSMLLVGSILPLALTPILVVYLPESLSYLVRENAPRDRVWHLLRKIDPAAPQAAPAGFTIENIEERSPVVSIFTEGRAIGTIFLWIVFILNLGVFYAIQNWLPTILTQLHHSVSTVTLATSLTTVGGISAALVAGPAMDRLGAYGSLAILYLFGVVCVGFLAAALNLGDIWILVSAFFAGFCVSGGQKSVIALGAIFYPSPIRSTGVGWALAIGRIGAIGAPMLVGYMLSAGLLPQSILYWAMVPMAFAAVLIECQRRLYRGGQEGVPHSDKLMSNDLSDDGAAPVMSARTR